MNSGEGIMEIGEGNWFMVGCCMSLFTSPTRWLMGSGGITINRIIQYVPSSLPSSIISGDKRQVYTLSRDYIRWCQWRNIAAIYGGLWITIRTGHRGESKLGGGGEFEDQASWISEGDRSKVGANNTVFRVRILLIT
jgi:hypothetical protein